LCGPFTAVVTRMMELMGIRREDKAGRADFTRKGYRYFDVPAPISVLLDKKYTTSSYFEIGAVTQTICLAALKCELGTCI
jgi:hypothetical protein